METLRKGEEEIEGGGEPTRPGDVENSRAVPASINLPSVSINY
jgi:hypothetical protein